MQSRNGLYFIIQTIQLPMNRKGPNGIKGFSSEHVFIFIMAKIKAMRQAMNRDWIAIVYPKKNPIKPANLTSPPPKPLGDKKKKR